MHSVLNLSLSTLDAWLRKLRVLIRPLDGKPQVNTEEIDKLLAERPEGEDVTEAPAKQEDAQPVAVSEEEVAEALDFRVTDSYQAGHEDPSPEQSVVVFSTRTQRNVMKHLSDSDAQYAKNCTSYSSRGTAEEPNRLKHKRQVQYAQERTTAP